MGYPAPLTTEGWARVRYEYESTDRKVFEICAEYGISESTLRDRVRRWGWTRRACGPVAREGPPPMEVTIIKAQAPESSSAEALAQAEEEQGDALDGIDELRANLKRQIDAIIEEEREARPRRYLAAWEEFAAEAAKPAPPCASDRPVHQRGKSRGDRRGRRHNARPAYSVTIKA